MGAVLFPKGKSELLGPIQTLVAPHCRFTKITPHLYLKVREEVRQAVFSLHARGEYPLIYKLSDVFPNGLMRQREAREAWREALQELGLES